MNKKNLILTSTVGMTRQQWLEFRQPILHVKKFICEWFTDQLASNTPIKQENVFFRSQMSHTNLKHFFASDEWKAYLFPCIGASEISPLLGLNPYYSSIELYYEKVGIKPYFDQDNEAMFWGRELEQEIADKWQYWDGSPEGMIANFNASDMKRKCRKINAYVQNRAFPWIFVSLDRIINKQYTEVEAVNEGSLECKTIVGFVSKMWEGGIPPMYVAQLQTQLGVFEFDFGEIAILKDGRYFFVYPFDKHTGIVNRLKKEAEEFFVKVKYGIQCWLLHQVCVDEHEQQRLYSEIERVAPEADGSDSYKNYLSEKYQQSQFGEEIEGTIVEEELARQYKFYDKRINDYKYMKTECRNKLCAYMKDKPILKLGDLGTVTWKEEGKKGRVFRVLIKADTEYTPEHFKALPSRTIEAKVIEYQDQDRAAKRKKPAKEKTLKPIKKVKEVILVPPKKADKKPDKKTVKKAPAKKTPAKKPVTKPGKKKPKSGDNSYFNKLFK